MTDLRMIQILPAAEADLPGIAALARVIWHAHYPGIISREQIEFMLGRMYSLPTLRDDLCVRNICFVRLLVGGRMSGFAAYGPMDGPATFLLHKLYLLPELHGRGLGRRLLEHCEADATKSGARQLKLRVNKQNLQAITFYQRHGYRSCESVCTAIGGGFVMDDLVMVKMLCAVS
jgi:ribosomal protein S18 acetylase RimI-like enzyme